MLETIATISVILWLVGLVSSHAMQGLITIWLVIASVLILVRVIQGRRLSRNTPTMSWRPRG